ncbi:MAG TPA: hypothetical protein VJ833_00060 [Rhodanobacteraceae bacterium]|nr:hypothetical protein [Rhodanobacteraceae bacterium]
MGSNKVQGEGDYDSARRYRKETEESVKEQSKGGKPIKGDARKASATLTPEEREGRARAKAPGQDKRDAAYMDELERKKKR